MSNLFFIAINIASVLLIGGLIVAEYMLYNNYRGGYKNG